jgi:proteic killer suppression protein
MIVSFGDRATEDLYHNRPTSRARRFPHDVVGLALVKLDMLNGSAAVLDLRSPPGNRLAGPSPWLRVQVLERLMDYHK